MGELDALLLKEQSRLSIERQKLREQISTAEGLLKQVEERLALVEGLLGPNHASKESPEESPVPDSHDIVGIAVEILCERDKEPMHYRELAKEIEIRGGNIPGVDKDHTLIARLVRDDRFVRPTRRGFYALRKDYPDAKNVGARKPLANSDAGSEQSIWDVSFEAPK